MSATRRRELTPFNLAFLDVMFCGFGAVVLLVLILQSQVIDSRKIQQADRQAELDRIEEELAVGKTYADTLSAAIADMEQMIEQSEAREGILAGENEALTAQLSGKERVLETSKQSRKAIQEKLALLDQEAQRKAAQVEQAQEQGRHVREFIGTGNRQYLTGLQLGGKRVLILIDRSASMLDEKIVNVLRLRNMDHKSQQQSPKWHQTKMTVAWLLANLAEQSQLQLMAFNTQTRMLGSEKGWVSVTDVQVVNSMMKDLDTILPEKGTSLVNAFMAIGMLTPAPDTIILLTDGLPTQDQKEKTKGRITGEKRAKLFARALKELPKRVPVNVILFPMEGDPLAAALFWKLAMDSGGSFLTPTRDWP